MTAKILEFKPRSKPEEPKPIDQLMHAIERDEAGRSPMEAALEGLKQAYTPDQLNEMFKEFDELDEEEVPDENNQP